MGCTRGNQSFHLKDITATLKNPGYKITENTVFNILVIRVGRSAAITTRGDLLPCLRLPREKDIPRNDGRGDRNDGRGVAMTAVVLQ